MKEIIEGFKEFFLEGEQAEQNEHYRAAASNYYKAIVQIARLLIWKKTGKVPKNHQEIFLFLKINFQEVYDIINPLFRIYQDSYERSLTKEEVSHLKDGINKISQREDVGEEIRVLIAKM
ncbi:hypothetical protein J4460_03740 [Candidatus Woesearchaeota archaeon]|nr:MAG: hypothetical protein QS99_C0009G0003 [archaeon GW2011_AR4]MBS3129761.1 hypothetical protein [Candidatus Woesearchaeota archaeon]HIH37453.1 hypothetical protein [Candidatus Woesearchaeota archaeon]HIH48207.1 hypothetical protein [Candidatus Woesearchaeota archaeon]HIJ02858.1 hypothetical protein [Candidatus Woesearchaeota archaeon]